jgi:hypothetical protein
MTTADDAGVVVVQAASHRRLMHLGAPPNGERTLCGRYASDRYEDPMTDVTGLRMCGACEFARDTKGRDWCNRRRPRSEADAV